MNWNELTMTEPEQNHFEGLGKNELKIMFQKIQ
jgi:hypothetical protein